MSSQSDNAALIRNIPVSPTTIVLYACRSKRELYDQRLCSGVRA